MHIESWYFKDMVLLSIQSQKAFCFSKLATENSAGALYEAQGKLEGLKIAEDKISLEFGPIDGTMARESDIPDVTLLPKSALENFSEDINRHRDVWIKISEFMGSAEEREKTELFEGNTLVSRDFKRAHGKRDGMRIFEKLMDNITDTLSEAKQNPTLFDVADETEEKEFPTEEFDNIEDGDQTEEPTEETEAYVEEEETEEEEEYSEDE